MGVRGESFPARLRSLGSSAMLTSDLVANVAVAAIFLTLLTRLGGAGTFIVFGVLAVAAFAFVFKLAPETKGRHLEEIPALLGERGKWPTMLLPDRGTVQQDRSAASSTDRRRSRKGTPCRSLVSIGGSKTHAVSRNPERGRGGLRRQRQPSSRRGGRGRSPARRDLCPTR